MAEITSYLNLLNMDCIDIIFNNLSILDIARVEKVYPEFKWIAEHHYSKVESCNLISQTGQNYRVTRLIAKTIISKIAPYVKRFEINTSYLENSRMPILTYIRLFMLQLDELVLKSVDLSLIARHNYQAFRGIKKLTIRNCTNMYSINRAFEFTDSLTYLDLYNQRRDIDSSILLKLTKIESMNLEFCFDVNEDHFTKFLINNQTTLKHLYVTNCNWLNSGHIQYITTELPYLETLAFSYNFYNFQEDKQISFSNIKTLKKVSVIFSEHIDNLLVQLVQLPNLEELSMMMICCRNMYHKTQRLTTFTRFRGLKKLILSRVNIKDNANVILEVLKNNDLEELHIPETYITLDDMKTFCQNRRNIKILDFANSNFFKKSDIFRILTPLIELGITNPLTIMLLDKVFTLTPNKTVKFKDFP